MGRARQLIKKILTSDVFLRLYKKPSRILMYHRIIDHPLIPGITPQQFEKHLRYLANHYTLVSVTDLVDSLQKGNSSNRIALSFDDGHFDFYQNAWPILKKYDAPATLYITTGFVNGTHWLWPDLLKHTLMEAHPGTYTLESESFVLTGSNLLSVWNQLGDHLLQLKAPERYEFILSLSKLLGVKTDEKAGGLFKSVSWQELREMQKGGLDIGCHTKTHPILSLSNASQLEEELITPKVEIEKQLGIKVSGICYPNGREIDINTSTLETCKKAGYEYGILAKHYKFNPENLFTIGRVPAAPAIADFKWRILESPTREAAVPL